MQQDKKLTVDNLSIGVVGKDLDFTMYEGQAVTVYLDRLNSEQGRVQDVVMEQVDA